MSKNNPNKRAGATALRTYGGKQVKPVLYINGKNRFIAAQFDDGNLAMDASSGTPIPYKNL